MEAMFGLFVDPDDCFLAGVKENIVVVGHEEGAVEDPCFRVDDLENSSLENPLCRSDRHIVEFRSRSKEMSFSVAAVENVETCICCAEADERLEEDRLDDHDFF